MCISEAGTIHRCFSGACHINYTARTIISAPPLQNAVSHTTEERMQLLPDTAVPCGGVTHGILQRWRAYDCTHCMMTFALNAMN
jgi:hypothetical protein